MSELLTPEKLGEIRQRHQASTVGPYYWHPYNNSLLAAHGRRSVVLSTVEDTPGREVLAVREGEWLGGILKPLTSDHPDAQALAASWQDRQDLLDHIVATEAKSQEFVEAVKMLVQILQEENETLRGRLESFRPLLRQHGIYFPATRREAEPTCDATR